MTRSSGDVRRGFSLIEVLIGILILALGLLGLGAIIPVIVREQRAAADTTLGIACANSAEKLLTSRPDLDYTNPTSNPDLNGWKTWFDDQSWSRNASSWLWQPWRTNRTPAELDLDLTTTNAANQNMTGDFTFYALANPPRFPVTIYASVRLADRLWPPLSRQGADVIPPKSDPYRPQFVWDFVGRRMHTATGEAEKIQIAIFVRRIGLSIRVPLGNLGGSNPSHAITLYDVLTDHSNVAGSDRRLPVVAHGPVGQWPPQGNFPPNYPYYGPTNDGVIVQGDTNYSAPILLYATFKQDTLTGARNRIQLQNTTGSAAMSVDDNRFRLAAQPGQRLVDNLGNVYTVLGEPDTNDSGTTSEVIVDPPVPSWIADTSAASAPPNPPLPAGALSPSRIQQIVFFAEIPAAVKLITITRPAP